MEIRNTRKTTTMVAATLMAMITVGCGGHSGPTGTVDGESSELNAVIDVNKTTTPAVSTPNNEHRVDTNTTKTDVNTTTPTDVNTTTVARVDPYQQYLTNIQIDKGVDVKEVLDRLGIYQGFQLISCLAR